MKHKATIWQTQGDIAGIIERGELDYPNQDPTVRICLSEHDLITSENSYFPAFFHDLADSLTPPFYGLAYLPFIRGEDCLPTNLFTPLFNLRALEVLRENAPECFTDYPVFVLDFPPEVMLPSARAYLSDARVKVAPEGFALLKARHSFDRSNARATKTSQKVMLESDQEIPPLFQSGDVFYFRDDLKERFTEAGISGLEFEAALGLSAFV